MFWQNTYHLVQNGIYVKLAGTINAVQTVTVIYCIKFKMPDIIKYTTERQLSELRLTEMSNYSNANSHSLFKQLKNKFLISLKKAREIKNISPITLLLQVITRRQGLGKRE